MTKGMTPATKPTHTSQPSSEAGGGTNGWPLAVSTSAAALPALAAEAAREATAAAAGVSAGDRAGASCCLVLLLPPLPAAVVPGCWCRCEAARGADRCACCPPCPWQQRQGVGVARGREDMAKQRLTLPKASEGVANRDDKLYEDEDWLHCGCKWRKREGGSCIPHAGTAGDLKRHHATRHDQGAINQAPGSDGAGLRVPPYRARTLEAGAACNCP